MKKILKFDEYITEATEQLIPNKPNEDPRVEAENVIKSATTSKKHEEKQKTDPNKIGEEEKQITDLSTNIKKQLDIAGQAVKAGILKPDDTDVKATLDKGIKDLETKVKGMDKKSVDFKKLLDDIKKQQKT